MSNAFANQQNVHYVVDWQQAADYTASVAKAGDYVITLGCGNVFATCDGSVRQDRAGDIGCGLARAGIDQRLRELVDVPRRQGSGAALVEEAQGQLGQYLGGRGQLDDRPPTGGPDAELGAGGIKRHQSEVGRPAGQITSTVVEDEQEPARELSKLRVRAQQFVEIGGDRSEVGAAAAEPGLGGDHEVAHELMGPGREKPGLLDRPHHLREQVAGTSGEPAQLQVGPAGEVDVAVAVLAGDSAQGCQRLRSQLSTDQSQPDEGAVIG